MFNKKESDREQGHHRLRSSAIYDVPYSFSYFPTWDKFNFKDWKAAKNFSPLNFLVSFLSIFLVLEILIYLLESFDFWIRNRFSKKEEDMLELEKEKLQDRL